MQEIADRRPAIFGSPKSRHVGFGRVVDRFDRAVGDGKANQKAGDRLDHRLRNEAVAVGPAVLVMLKENLIVLGDQQSRDRIAREVAGHFSPKRFGKCRRCALEPPGHCSTLHLPRRIDVVDVGESADAIGRLPRIALPSGPHGIGNGVFRRSTIALGIGTD